MFTQIAIKFIQGDKGDVCPSFFAFFDLNVDYSLWCCFNREKKGTDLFSFFDRPCPLNSIRLPTIIQDPISLLILIINI